MVKQVFVVAGKRSAFGNFGGSFTRTSATQLAVETSKQALASAGIRPELVDAVFVGNVASTSMDGAYLSRHVQLKTGIPKEKPALTVNRLCGSGFQSVVSGLQDIQLGESNINLCAGAENMSQSPLAVFGENCRFGVGLGAGMNLTDTLWSALTDSHAKMPMGITAENLAEKYEITREDCDKFGLKSQELWQKANENGDFKDEIAPIEVKGKKGKVVTVDTDEGPRLTPLEKLSKLKPVFKKDGVVHAGNASGISDGAGSIVLASEDAVKEHNLSPLARIVSYHIAGVDPTIMGIGPVPAIQGALKRANLTLNDMDFIEINEAFAAQYLACEKALGYDQEKGNTCGGAIALGHPLGASGSRITAHLAHKLKRTGKKYAVGSACIGGGQGIAIVLENVNA